MTTSEMAVSTRSSPYLRLIARAVMCSLMGANYQRDIEAASVECAKRGRWEAERRSH